VMYPYQTLGRGSSVALVFINFAHAVGIRLKTPPEADTAPRQAFCAYTSWTATCVPRGCLSADTDAGFGVARAQAG
jgi:hypothetical protein